MVSSFTRHLYRHRRVTPNSCANSLTSSQVLRRSTALRWNFREYRFRFTLQPFPAKCAHPGCLISRVQSIGTYPRFQCKLLDVVVLMFSVMMAVAGAKEPQIAGRAAIRVLKQHMVKEPIFEAASSRSKELFAAAIGTTRDLSLRSGFVHGKTLCWGRLFYA